MKGGSGNSGSGNSGSGHSGSGHARYWGVVAAAGLGERMQAALPKQYLPVAGATVLEHTLQRLLDWDVLSGLVVALHPRDQHWQATRFANDERIVTVTGGAQRCDSVLAALQALQGRAAPGDWVLVHDAARPCISHSDLQTLCDALAEDAVGGLLAVPVTDTVKQAGPDGRVQRTLERGQLWLAQTPQMFRYNTLLAALESVVESGVSVTDEAAAIELQGLAPRLVAAEPGNIKITRPADLALAGFWLASGEQR